MSEEEAKVITKVLVQGEDVTAALDVSEGVDWSAAVREYRRDELSGADLDELGVPPRPAGTRGVPAAITRRFEVFAGYRTPAGGGNSESWTGRNYWADVYYGQAEDTSSDV